MLYSNINDAFDNQFEKQYKQYTNNNFFNLTQDSEPDAVSSFNSNKHFTLLDSANNWSGPPANSKEKPSKNISDTISSDSDESLQVKGTTVDELRERSNKFNSNVLHAQNHFNNSNDFDEVFNQVKPHEYYVKQFLKDINTNSDDLTVNTSGEVYNHIRTCKECKEIINQSQNKEIKEITSTIVNKKKKSKRKNILNNTTLQLILIGIFVILILYCMTSMINSV